MFISYDLNNFGNCLKELRIKLKLTQLNVSEKTNIHVDTLRKLENGNALPRYETLELLSQLYHIDLLEILQLKRVNMNLMNFYKKLDTLLINNDLSSLNQTLKEIDFFLSNYSNFNLVNSKELDCFKVFILASTLFNKDDSASLLEAEQHIDMVLKHVNPYFELNKLTDLHFIEIELRLLSLLSATKMKLQKIDEAIPILVFLCKYINNLPTKNNHTSKIILKLYYNLSYCYHINDHHTNSLKIATEGIVYAISNDLIYMLPNLYARKAISEKNLLLPSAQDSCEKSINLLKITSQNELLIEYKRIFKELYNFDIID